MPAGHGYAAVGGKNARSVAPTGGYLVTQAGVKIPESADCTDSGNAAEQLISRKAAYHTVRNGACKSRRHDRV